MSTKIYNAYLYNGSIESLRKFLVRLRKKRTEHWLPKLDYRQLMELSGMTNPGSVEKLRIQHMDENVVVYTHCEYFLIIQFFVNDTEFHKQLSKYRKLIDFHYQNQVDKPHNIAPTEWKKRKRIWDRIFNTDQTPHRAGFNYNLFNLNTAIIEKSIALDRKING